METWSVYIVRCADGSLYTGIATEQWAEGDAHNFLDAGKWRASLQRLGYSFT